MSDDLVIDALRQRCLSCRKCPIGGVDVDGHLSNVFSNMNVDADVVVVGQNPGRTEVAMGEPFVGRSGEFFDEKMREVLGVGRDRFYVTNIVHCYTTGNRKPSAAEVDRCSDFLDEEIALVAPRVLVSLGALALRRLTGRSGIMKTRGSIVASPRYELPVVPMLHPSPLNMSDPERVEMFCDDLELLREFLE